MNEPGKEWIERGCDHYFNSKNRRHVREFWEQDRWQGGLRYLVCL